MPEDTTIGPDDEFADIEALLRELEPADLELDAPPDDLWAGIAASVASDQPTTATVTSLSNRGRLRRPLLAVAAAAALVVGGSVIVSTLDNDDNGGNVIARAALAYDPISFDPLGSGTSAEAALVDDTSGLVIVIDDEVFPSDIGVDADLELWLIEADDTGAVVDLVSLGELDPGGDTSFVVPAGYDTSIYSVVDISIEPRDGDPTHSGRSILRGMLSST